LITILSILVVPQDQPRSNNEQPSQFKHLADLPDLHKPKEQVKLVLDLELPTEVNRRRPMLAETKVRVRRLLDFAFQA
jgi:hypothetical protein